MLLGAFFVLVGILVIAPAPFLKFLPQRLVFIFVAMLLRYTLDGPLNRDDDDANVNGT